MNGNKGSQPQPQPPQPTPTPQHQLNIGVPILSPTPAVDDSIIRPKWEEGDRVDYVPRGMSQAPSVMATSLGQGLVGGSFSAAAQRAQEEQEGRRHRAVIDKAMPDGNYRIIVTSTLETVWAHPDEIEPLGVIDRMADMVGPESRTLKDGLEEMKRRED